MDAVNRSLGERIRAARRTRGLSLLDVEAMSGGEFKASVLGAYERGERSMSVARLLRLAGLYDVHPAGLLPVAPAAGDDEVVVDLDLAEKLAADRGEVLDGFLAAIQRMRHDPSGPTLAVRRSDLKVLAALLGEAAPSNASGEGDDS